MPNKNNQTLLIIGIIILLLVIINYQPLQKINEDVTIKILNLYDIKGEKISIPSWFSSQINANTFEEFQIATKSPATTCTLISECLGYCISPGNPVGCNPNIACWKSKCSLTNVGAFDMQVTAENTYPDVILTNVHVESANPSVFFSALPTTTYTMNPGETKTWVGRVNITSLSGVKDFNAIVNGISSYDLTIKSGASPTTQLEFSPDPTGGLTVELISSFSSIPSAEKLYESHTINTNWGGIYAQYYMGQTFTIGTTGTNENFDITKISLLLYRKGNPGTCQFAIRAVSGGLPTGPDLSTGNVNANTLIIDVAGQWYNISMSSYTLSASTMYAVIWNCPSGNNLNYMAYRLHYPSSTYSGGTEVDSIDFGVTWSTTPTSDAPFMVYGVKK